MAWTSLCELCELVEGLGKYVEVEGFQLAIYLHGGRVYAMDNHCPHAGGSMVGGHIVDGCAICPWHGWAFRLDNGELREYAAVTIAVYETRLLKSEGYSTLVQADLPDDAV